MIVQENTEPKAVRKVLKLQMFVKLETNPVQQLVFGGMLDVVELVGAIIEVTITGKIRVKVIII